MILIAVLRMLAFALLCAVIIPVQSLVLALSKGNVAYIFPRLWHKAVCLIFNIKIKVNGEVSTDVQTLYLSNHLSYLDIPALGSVIKTASFVAKKDVESWPLFGFLAKLQQTAFISRARQDSAKVTQTLDSMLKEGKNLIVFPEGTSTDGQKVRPFKSSLFEMALGHSEHLFIQPISIRVVSSGGVSPKTQEERDLYAWHIDMDTELPVHLWAFAKRSGAVLEFVFHPVFPVKEYQDRKTLAKVCHDTVSKGLDI